MSLSLIFFDLGQSQSTDSSLYCFLNHSVHACFSVIVMFNASYLSLQIHHAIKLFLLKIFSNVMVSSVTKLGHTRACALPVGGCALPLEVCPTNIK